MPKYTITDKQLTADLNKARAQQAREKEIEYPEEVKDISDDPNVVQEKHEGIIPAAISQGLGPMVGIRKQEDRAFIAELQDLSAPSPLLISQLFNDALLDVGEQCKTFKAGSTYVGCLLWDKWIITANIGDSYALLLMQDEKDQLQATRLNWSHKPSDPEEHKRIKDTGGIVGKDLRLNGRFSVSRAIGDAIEPVGYRTGLIAQPSLTAIESPTQGGYLVLASDGLSDVMSSDEIAEFFGRIKETDKIANELRRSAYAKGSKDNTTVIVATIPAKVEKQDLGVLLSVADGHGGDEVSEYLRQNFSRIFEERIHQGILQDDVAESKSTPSSLSSSSSSSSSSSTSTRDRLSSTGRAFFQRIKWKKSSSQDSEEFAAKKKL